MIGARARVFLVEDEELIALLLEDMLLDLACEISVAAASLDDAVAAARTGAFDLAMIDLNLGGKPAYPVADVLRARRIPFILVTGYGTADVLPAYADQPILEKPFRRQDLEAMVTAVLADRRRSE